MALQSRYKILKVWAVDVWKAQPEEKRNERFLSISLMNSLIRPPTLHQATEGKKKNHLWINKKKNIKEVEAIKVLCMYADDDVILFSNDR